MKIIEIPRTRQVFLAGSIVSISPLVIKNRNRSREASASFLAVGIGFEVNIQLEMSDTSAAEEPSPYYMAAPATPAQFRTNTDDYLRRYDEHLAQMFANFQRESTEWYEQCKSVIFELS